MSRAFALGLTLLLASAARSEESAPAVRDGEKLFGKAAVERVGILAADIKETFGIQFVVETSKAPPGVDPATLRTMRSKDVTRKLRDAAQKRADDLGVNGLFVQITTAPPHVTVVGWPVSRELEPGGSSYKREEMRKYLARHLDKTPDDALVRAVESYRGQLGERLHHSPLGTLRALAVVGALVGVWVLLWFVRNRTARSGGPLPIYRPAMLGSLFGVPAGFWVHDQLFQAERPAPMVALTEAPAEPVSEAIKSAPEGIQTPAQLAVQPAAEEEP